MNTTMSYEIDNEIANLVDIKKNNTNTNFIECSTGIGYIATRGWSCKA